MDLEKWNLVSGEDKKIIIAGPCALESKAQLINCATHLQGLGVKIIRASLWKPRTSPSWEGLGYYGLPMLLEETISRGLTPATEIFTAAHAQMVIDGLKFFGNEGKMIVWLGARNQNHFEIRQISKILAEGPPSLKLMFKNQVWYDPKHWFGIYQHIIETHFPKERLLGCHRGFHPGYSTNPSQWRNIPELELAIEMKEIMEIPMLLDPSHIAGDRGKVFKIMEESQNFDFDGYMVEVHDDLSTAKTDSVQQLSFHQFEMLLDLIRGKNNYNELKAEGW